MSDVWCTHISDVWRTHAFCNQGATGRVKAVLAKILNGETTRIGAIGGSVTRARNEQPGEDLEGGYL